MKSWRVVAVLSSALAAGSLDAEIVERVVAKANGGIVTLSEFEARQVAAVQSARIPPDQIEAYLRDNNQRILQEAIDDVILVKRGEAQGIRVRPEYVDEILDGIKKENNFASDQEMADQLRREGMSLGDLRRSLERSIVKRQVLARELEPKAAVTDAEALAEYQKNVERYHRPESVHLFEIVVESEARARDVAAKARGGADFAELAKAQSAAASRERGGDLGTVTRGDLAAELEKVAFSLPLGGISDPLPTGDGTWRVLKVAARNEASTASFEEMKPALTQQLAQTKMLREYEAYMSNLRAQADIQITVREVPLSVDPEAAAPSLAAPAAPGTVAPPPASAPAGPAPRPAAALPGVPEDEISVTPQSAPRRVVPDDGIPAAPPSPAPSPEPPAGG
jgi:parvulin-like peptidyl-prolyl isomerase